MIIIITVALIATLACPTLAGKMVYDLDSGRTYYVNQEKDSTRVYDLGPGEGQVTIGRRLPSGNSMVFSSPECPPDDLAAGLAVSEGEDDGEME